MVLLVFGLAAWQYNRIWFYTEFWIGDKVNRRPFTFILRDLYHQGPVFVIVGLMLAGHSPLGGLIFTREGLVVLGIGLLTAHLFWGKEYIPGEQEQPAYNPEAEIKSVRFRHEAAAGRRSWEKMRQKSARRQSKKA